MATDDSWDAWDPERFVNPSPGKNWYKHMLEGIDARHEPVGWRDTISPAAPAGFGKAVVLAAANSTTGTPTLPFFQTVSGSGFRSAMPPCVLCNV